jgi:hypothetical protein
MLHGRIYAARSHISKIGKVKSLKQSLLGWRIKNNSYIIKQ